MTNDTPLDSSDITDDVGADASIDRLNLVQALRDFELANRRVIDLTQRLTSVHRELLDARSELQYTRLDLERTRVERDQIRADIVGLQGSNSYRVARVLAHARGAIRR